jgi:SAM-dependent methyltransferase
MPRSHFCSKKNNELSQELAAWFAASPGARVVRHERELVAEMVGDLFGYHLLQLGELGVDMAHLDACPVKRKILVSGRPDAAGAPLLVADSQALAVASDSVDAVILAHTLDFSPDPQRVLREVERVLIAEGRVIVIGFNPFSLWGLWRLVRRWRGDVPWCGHFLSYPRLNDWLNLLGLDVERSDVMEFRPPTRSDRFDGFERLGRRAWPMAAGVYVVRAVKRVSRVTPLRLRWSRLGELGSGAIEPTVRGAPDA